MIEKTLIKKDEKSRIRISNNAAKQLNKNKESSSCGSCGVCSRLSSPHSSSESATSALSHAKAMGKESCAVSFMQKNYGNGFTAKLLSRPSAVGGQPTIQKKCSCGGSCSKCKGEEEAEKVSMSIMRMGSGQQSVVGGRQTADSGEHAQISEIMSNKGSGHGLDDNSRSFMGERFGYDFSHVRLHTDNYAVKKSNELNAEAFTIGRDVFFNAGRYNPSLGEGKKLLSHELTHVVQQNSSRRGLRVQRQPAAPVVPNYRDCTPHITGIPDANERLEAARQRGRDYIDVAISRLGSAPAAGSTYATALNRHFVASTAVERNAIEATYRQIRVTLREENYICNSNNICGREQAFWIHDDNLVHVCRPFWPLNLMCRAIILIHEGAHDVGIGIGAHPPNRGSADYPAGNVVPPAGQTAAARSNNPDAYAFFAAHVWRDTDTGRTCF